MRTCSDERLKELFNGEHDIVKAFSAIDAYEFNYTPEAQEMYGQEVAVDDGTNIGVMAQELEKNPVTENVVVEDPATGYKMIDTRKLAATDAAVLSDVCKRLLVIEQKLGIGEQ